MRLVGRNENHISPKLPRSQTEFCKTVSEKIHTAQKKEKRKNNVFTLPQKKTTFLNFESLCSPHIKKIVFIHTELLGMDK